MQYYNADDDTDPNTEQIELTNPRRGTDNPQKPFPNDNLAGSSWITENVNPSDYVRGYMEGSATRNTIENNATAIRNSVKFMICEKLYPRILTAPEGCYFFGWTEKVITEESLVKSWIR